MLLAVLTVFCACSGGGSTTTTTTIPRANSPVNTPSGNVQSVQLGLQPTSATLPVVAQITGTLLFPAVRIPATISLSGSATAPAGVALESLRRAQSGTLTVYEYVTIVSPITTSLPSLPAMTLHFPASTPLAGKSVYYGISELNAQGGLVSFNTQGPGTIDGQTVSFALVPTPITYEAGHKYTFVVYATGAGPVKVGASRIYVVGGASPNYSTITLTTYKVDGTQARPATVVGPNYSFSFGVPAVAVNAAGKIYVANYNTVTTYKADGTPTTPTITAGVSGASGIAIDANGKIYVSNFQTNSVTTYNADGTQTTPTITAGLNNPSGVAVDAAGKIYVANYGNLTVTTYDSDGKRTTPTITASPNNGYVYVGGPGVAVDAAGKIYVANVDNFTVTTYQSDGTPTTPTIVSGLSLPAGIAVDVAGKIYVANSSNAFNSNGTVTTYNADGTPTTPTISVAGTVSIAVH